jgi:1-acyl-sn-glycerol-3-phosphate acyltransferase
MNWLRVVVRLLALLAWTLWSHLTIAASRPFRGVAPRWQMRHRNAAFRRWARGFARIVGMRIAVEGPPPEGPFLLVANHLGYMDIVLLAAVVDAAFVAKADLRSWPVLGRAFATADTIFIDRGRRRDVMRVGDQIRRDLDRDLGVILFPEATSTKGDGVLPFRPPLLDFAARRDHPVHYAAISYSTARGEGSASDLVCWWGDAPFLPHLRRLLRLPRFNARLVFGDVPVRDTDRKALARKLHEATVQSFTPIG